MGRIADLVRSLSGQRPALVVTPEEAALAVHLRGNGALLRALEGVILPRLEARAGLPEPQDAVACKSLVARDRELRWVLDTLRHVYNMPIQAGTIEPDDDEEPPA